ncbi:MAG: beta-lactamase family protein [Pirellulaceae bacterium]|nr:beta-lactamase family protein [Pirellulaceae bacterium]
MNHATPLRAPLVLVCLLLILAVLAIDGFAQSGDRLATGQGNTDYGAAVANLRELIADELQRAIISGVSVALVDDDRTILAEGFGMADEQRRVAANERTIYRVGSISKLFTALAAMQLAEQGKIDIDAPVRDILPDVSIHVPFEPIGPITLRQLMCHRSGMVRESPRGSYFDPTEPSSAETVASLAACALVNPPNTKTRYSNLGPTIVGETVARVAGTSFPEYQEKHVLGPLGMTQSAWLMNDRLHPHLATGYMRVADGKGGFFRIAAPRFELGTIGAGNLYSNVTDMARFAQMLLGRGRIAGRTIVRPETLDEMWTPQLTDEKNGFGLGFNVAQFAGHKTVQHMGAVYGFTSSLVVLPEARIAVVVLCNEDVAKGPVIRIANAALEQMLAAKLGKKPKDRPAPVSLDPEQLASLVGDYESPSYWAEIRVIEGRIEANVSGQKFSLAPIGPLAFEGSGQAGHRVPVRFVREGNRVVGFTAIDQTFTRVDENSPREVPKQWLGYLGSYGPDFIPLIVSQRNGRLYAMTENVADYRLTAVNRYVFKFPPGLYDDEFLVFHVDRDGKAHGVDLANIPLSRNESSATSNQHE